MSATQTEGMIVYKLHPLIVSVFHNSLSCSFSTAKEDGDSSPSLCCYNSSHRLATVWLQHWSHQCTRTGVCVVFSDIIFLARLYNNIQ